MSRYEPHIMQDIHGDCAVGGPVTTYHISPKTGRKVRIVEGSGPGTMAEYRHPGKREATLTRRATGYTTKEHL